MWTLSYIELLLRMGTSGYEWYALLKTPAYRWYGKDGWKQGRGRGISSGKDTGSGYTEGETGETGETRGHKG